MEISLDRALLYAILQAGIKGFFKAREFGLKAEHIEDVDKDVFALFETFSRKGRLPTMIEIAAECPHVTITVPDVATDPFDVEHFAKKVADRALQTKLKDGLGPIARQQVDDPRGARTALQELVKDTSWSIGSVTSFKDPQIAKELQEDYEKAKSTKGGLLGLSSPWPNVDCHSKGLQPGELTVLLAKRKTGKSWLMLAWVVWCLKNDLKPGESVLVISMEMPRKAIYRRMAAIALRLCYKDFRGGTLTSEEEARFYDWIKAVMEPTDESMPTIHVACSDTIGSVTDICDKVAELRPRAVFLDGMYILGRESKKGMWERTIDNCAALKIDLATSMDIPVLATTQLKGSKNKNDLNADADDAAYAKAIGDWADVMRGAFMNQEYEKAKKRVSRAMESRAIQGVDLKINFDLELMNFSEEKVMDDDSDEGVTEESPLAPPPTPESIIPAPLIDGSGSDDEEIVEY